MSFVADLKVAFRSITRAKGLALPSSSPLRWASAPTRRFSVSFGVCSSVRSSIGTRIG